MQRLKFQTGNAKIHYTVATFSLPSGTTCPFARECKSKAHRITGKITDGKFTKFRCSSASDEARSPHARRARNHNWDLLRPLKTVDEITELIEFSLTGHMVTRVHVGGDYFNQRYFDAWVNVASNHSGQMFYGYTKSLPYWVKRLDSMPRNLNLTASMGGECDSLIDEYNLRYSRVVFHPRQAERLGLEIDHDDSHAMIYGDESFALLLHGTQPSGSDAASALKTMRAENIKFSYSRN